MLISAIKKTTLLDYPWKIACIIFTTWCNMRCKFCYNKEFVLPEEIKKIKDFIPEQVFFNFLETRTWILDWVVICGWEPTVHKDLYDFAKKIKEMWFLVKLDTNWQNPDILKKLIDDEIVDYIAMDIKTSFDKYDQVTQIKEDFSKYKKSVELIKNSPNIDYEFRTTLVKYIHTKENIEEISSFLSWAKRYYFQNFRAWNTLQENFEWKSFDKKELKEFEKIAKKYIKDVKIREYDE